MEYANRRYSEDEVTQIIRHALSRPGPKDTISHQELVDIARASGISADKLERAIEHMQTYAVFEDAKKEWLQRHRADFYNHFTAYCIVNGFLLFVNLITSRGYLWVVWPLMAWGIGIAFHFVDTFFVSQERIEKGAERLLAKKRRNARNRRDVLEREGYEG